MPSADELIVAWPEEAFAQVGPDHATAIVILTHDDKFDLPALELALATDAFYVGLIGGRRNQERKRERLREAGVAEEAIERISGPCGLDIGADSVPETALSILAEAMAARNGRAGGLARQLDAAHPRVSRTAVVTGAARGLGEAIARRLAADGDRVLLADVDVAGAARVAAEIGGEAVEHDVRSLESWERLLAAAGEVDVLVNNAARTEIRPFWEIDVDEWDDVLATNLRGTYLGIRVVGAQMRDRGAGRIVNLTSVAGQNSRAVTGVHYASLEGRDRRADAPRRDRAGRIGRDRERRRAGGDRRADGRDRRARAAGGDAEDDPRRQAGTAGGGRRGGGVSGLGRRRLRHRRDPRRQRRDADAMRMRAAVMHEPGALVVEELDVEEPLPGEVVVRMSAVGVCGTDLHSYKGEWDRPTPIVLGHEGAGLVEAVGSEVEGLSEGDRVVLSWAPACGECGPCRRGRPAACGPLSSAIGTRDAARRPHRADAERRDRLSRHGDRRARGAGRGRRRRGDAVRRRGADGAGGAARLRRAHRGRRRAQRRAARSPASARS